MQTANYTTQYKNLKQLSHFLVVTGILAVSFGLILEFSELKGYLNNKNRAEVMNWILHSEIGLPLETPSAKEFAKYFPPPADENMDSLTHLTKLVLRQESGGIYNVQINYMRKDGSRTNYVATLYDIRKWASENSYPWLSWWLTLIGFIELLGNYFIERKIKKSRT